MFILLSTMNFFNKNAFSFGSFFFLINDGGDWMVGLDVL